MQRTEYNNALESNFKRGLEIMKGKNMDYAGAIDPFKNFRAVESFDLTVEQGILVRMSDKMARIGNLIKAEAQVKDESIEDTLLDLANYANILLVYIQQQPKREPSDTADNSN